MQGPLKQQIETRLPWLFSESNFRVVYHDYVPKQMGSSSVEMQSDSLQLKFVFDGSAISVEVASLSDPERWMELGFLWYSLTGERPTPQLEGWGWFVRTHLSELADALGPKFSETRQRFEKCEAESREILARYVPTRTTAVRMWHWKQSPLGGVLFGPAGWIVAAALALWLAIK